MPTVAYLGPEKTNTHFAARKKFGAGARYLHAPTVEDVFRLVEGKKADYGVVPIENSLEGAVTHTMDRFIGPRSSAVQIWGEIEIPIRHSLILLPWVDLKDISTVYSHPQALAQCRDWLRKRLPSASLVETASTSEAAGFVSKNEAAIGREDLVKGTGMKSIPIPLARDNKTRFVVISLKRPTKAARSKTSLMFVLRDKPGALHDALVPFKTYGINLSKIESRPTKRKAWEYVFFVDFSGHESDSKVRKVLEALRSCTAEVRVLGSYPVGGLSGSS